VGQNKEEQMPWVARIYHPVRMQVIVMRALNLLIHARITETLHRYAAIDTRYPTG
jgi:hypothetical protein